MEAKMFALLWNECSGNENGKDLLIAVSVNEAQLVSYRDSIIEENKKKNLVWTEWFELSCGIIKDWIYKQLDCFDFVEGRKYWTQKSNIEIVDDVAFLLCMDRFSGRSWLWGKVFTGKLPFPTNIPPEPERCDELDEDYFDIIETKVV